MIVLSLSQWAFDLAAGFWARDARPKFKSRDGSRMDFKIFPAGVFRGAFDLCKALSWGNQSFLYPMTIAFNYVYLLPPYTMKMVVNSESSHPLPNTPLALLVTQILKGPISAISKLFFASDGSFCSMFQNLQDWPFLSRTNPNSRFAVIRITSQNVVESSGLLMFPLKSN